MSREQFSTSFAVFVGDLAQRLAKITTRGANLQTSIVMLKKFFRCAGTWLNTARDKLECCILI